MKLTDIKLLLWMLLCMPMGSYSQQKKNTILKQTDSVYYIKAASKGINIKFAVLNKYKKISTAAGHPVLPSEQLVNMIGLTYLDANKTALAYLFFEMNQKNYPGSFHVYDTMGDYYTATGNIPLAINEYKKAIHLNYNTGTVEKLKSLQGDREHR